MYCLLNPEIDAPYLNDIASAGLQQSVESLKKLLEQQTTATARKEIPNPSNTRMVNFEQNI